MSEEKLECKSKCKCNADCNCISKELPVVIGGIVVYELAIIIVMLILLFLDLDEPCRKPHSMTTEPEETSPVE